MPTLIFTPRFTSDSQALWRAGSSLGWRIERLGSWQVPDHLRNLADPVFYGEALFGPTLAEQLGISLLNPPEDWLVRLPYEYRLRNISMTSMGNARSNSTPAFVKPPNDKSFPAGVYAGNELPVEYDADMPVLVSEIVQWQKEFRCFVLNRTLQTFSVYLRNGELQEDSGFVSSADEELQLQSFLDKLLADSEVDLPHAVVIDVGLIEGRGWACVELNAAWGAGIYGCDPALVLPVLEKAVAKV